MEANPREMECSGTANYKINLNTNILAGSNMRSDSGKALSFINNTDVRGEFEKIIGNQNSLSYWKNYIRKRLKFSIISKYERNITEDDILGQLQLWIYEKNLLWDKVRYKNFRHFMYSKIQNIIRNMEKSLTIKYEKYLLDEEPGKKELDACPTTHPESAEEYVEINTDRIGKPLCEGEDKFAMHSSFPKKWLNRAKFRETVRDILKDVKYTDLLAVFTGLMEGKARCEIKAEYGFTEREFDNIMKRLYYKLRKELPKEYEEMFSQ